MRRVRGVMALGMCALIAGCTMPVNSNSTPTPRRPFTVTTTESPTTFDPAAATTTADAIVALNSFSRLMVVHPQGADLKPDLATDCLYTSPTSYECKLPQGLTFHNGHSLTSSDVKFSIERAYRLNVASSSIRLFDSLERVDVVDDLTVRFELKFADTQFGYALATPAASIVDEELYDPDVVRPRDAQVVGSGPYALVTSADDHLIFERFKQYRGALTGVIDEIRLNFAADSAGAERAVADGTTDVIWRSLTAPAMERLGAEMNANGGATKTGFRRVPMPQNRLQRVMFNQHSPYRDNQQVRAAVAMSLQSDRSAASIIPAGVAGSVPSFPVGGEVKIPDVGGQRPRLTLGFVSKAPGQRDLAGLIRDRLESSAGISVLLQPNNPDADLQLTDRPAWVNTAFGWLQTYVDDTLPGTQVKVNDLLRNARATSDAATRAALLAEIQQQAAVDLTVLPQSVGVETMLLGPGVHLEGQAFGPAWQLGLWSLRL